MLVIIFLTMLAIVITIIAGIYIIITRMLKEYNPNLCYVFPYFEHILNKPQKGKKEEKTDNGIRYSVKGKYLDIPKTYPVIWHKRRRTFFTDVNGELITNFDVKGQSFKLSAGDKDDLQFELGTSNLITQAVRAFKGKNDAMIMIFAIIIFVIGGGLGYGIGKVTTQPKVVTQVVTVNATAFTPLSPISVSPIK